MDISQLNQLIASLEKLGTAGVQALQWLSAHLTTILDLIHKGIPIDTIVQIILRTLGLA